MDSQTQGGCLNGRLAMTKIHMRLLEIWQGATIRWTLLGACVLLVALDYYDVTLFGTHVDTDKIGTLGDWVSGVGALLAVLVALYIARGQHNERLMREHTEAVVSRTRIFCWLAVSKDDRKWQLFIDNHTLSPVTMWRIGIHDSKTQEELASMTCHDGPVIQPGITDLHLAMSNISKLPECHLSIVDAEGECWTRRSDGRLDPIDSILLGEQEYQSVVSAVSRHWFKEPRT